MWQGLRCPTSARRCCGRSWSSSLLGSVLLLLALLAPRAARAEIEFEVPRECGTLADFRRQLESLAEGVRAPEPSVLQIRPEGTSFRLHLELSGEEREILDPDCPTLLRSAVVITAAAGRAEAPPPPPAAAAAPAPTAVAAAAPATVVATPALPPPTQARSEATVIVVQEPDTDARAAALLPPPRAAFTLGAGAGISGGTVPGTSAVLELRAGLDPAPVGAALTVRYWPGASAEKQGRNIDVNGVGARAALVAALGRTLHAALGLEVDRLSGSGQEGVSGRSTDSAWRLAAALDLNVIPWSVDHLRIELGAGAQLALVRPRFVITGFTDVYEVPPVGGAAIIRGVWLFP